MYVGCEHASLGIKPEGTQGLWSLEVPVAAGVPVGPEYSSWTPLFVLVILCLWASVLGKDLLKQRSTENQCVEVESRTSGSR